MDNEEFSRIDLSKTTISDYWRHYRVVRRPYWSEKNTYSLALLTNTNYKMIFISKLSLLIDSSYSVFYITIADFVANLSKKISL
jgi:hypothetical protein